MRKYLQITTVLAIFSLVVFFRQFKGTDETPVVGLKNNSQAPTPTLAPVTTVQNQTPTSTPAQGNSNTMMPTKMPMMGMYKDGSYTGSVEDAFYGNIQVQAKISNGKISDVVFLQFPNDNRTSRSINSQADPMLTQEAIQVQNANVDIISGASASSQAFQASLANALAQAKN